MRNGHADIFDFQLKVSRRSPEKLAGVSDHSEKRETQKLSFGNDRCLGDTAEILKRSPVGFLLTGRSGHGGIYPIRLTSLKTGSSCRHELLSSIAAVREICVSFISHQSLVSRPVCAESLISI